MAITARVIADSAWEDGRSRLTTFVLRYPRFVHSEVMTHRVFSRNASSSRAIPVKKMIEQAMNAPAMPVFWGKNQSGMQAQEELSEAEILAAKMVWLDARDAAVDHAQQLLSLGVHKQIANRILEPWMYIEVVITATDWANFYALRDHADAQPEIRELARVMLEAHQASTPQKLKQGEWHLPFISDEDRRNFGAATDGWLLPKISAARCARVSYLKHDGTQSTVEEDLALFERLMGGNPKHASPTEHQARVPIVPEFDSIQAPDDYTFSASAEFVFKPELRSNLDGWVQFRKLIQGENVTSYKGFTK
jgi:hypothetical protein